MPLEGFWLRRIFVMVEMVEMVEVAEEVADETETS
jgi:hypothetical protein